MHARRLAAAHQLEAEPVIVARHAVELEPEHVRRNPRRLLDGDPADGAERIGHARALGGLGHVAIGAWPHDARPAHRRDADRRLVLAPEQIDLDRRQRRHHAVARHQLDSVQRRPVAGDAVVGAGAAVAVFIGKARDAPARAPAQVRDGRKALLELGAAPIGGLLIG
jgi:hypothetical protein